MSLRMEYHFLTPDDRDGTMTVTLTGEGIVVDLFIEGEFDTTWARDAQELADLIHALSWTPNNAYAPDYREEK